MHLTTSFSSEESNQHKDTHGRKRPQAASRFPRQRGRSCLTRADLVQMNAEVAACVSTRRWKTLSLSVTSTADLEGFFSIAFFVGGANEVSAVVPPPPTPPPCLCSFTRSAATAPQRRCNKSSISLSSLHVFVAVWQRNHLFPVDGGVPALHTNRVHHVAGGDTSSFTHFSTFVFGKTTSLWKRCHPGQWLFRLPPFSALF